jgi:adenylate kinase family enzyme
VIGNAGAGKSYVAQALAAQVALPVIDLDDIFWLDGSYTTKRPADQVWTAIDRVREQPRWIVEGVYGSVVERLLDRAELLIGLALSWTECSRSLVEREQTRHSHRSPELEKGFEALMAYAAAYDRRTNDISRQGHQRRFDLFTGTRMRFESRAGVDASSPASSRPRRRSFTDRPRSVQDRSGL